jgi:hypothetical protein
MVAMTFDLDLHEENWTFDVDYGGLKLALTIHHNLEDGENPVYWSICDASSRPYAPKVWSETSFPDLDQALAHAKQWIHENVRGGKLPS